MAGGIDVVKEEEEGKKTVRSCRSGRHGQLTVDGKDGDPVLTDGQRRGLVYSFSVYPDAAAALATLVDAREREMAKRE